jgi:hypothetical protein
MSVIMEPLSSQQQFSILSTSKPHDKQYHSHKFNCSLFALIIFILLMNAHFLFFLGIHVSKTSIDTHNETLPVFLLNGSVDIISFKNMSLQTKDLVFFECSPSSDDNVTYAYFFEKFWLWLELLAYIVCPSLIAGSCIALIFLRVREFNQKYAKLLSDPNYKTNAKIYLKRMRQNNQIVYKLIAIEVYFILSSSVYVTYAMLASHEMKKVFALRCLIDIAFYGNYSLNIIFYGMLSEKYRRETVRIFKVTLEIIKNKFRLAT